MSGTWAGVGFCQKTTVNQLAKSLGRALSAHALPLGPRFARPGPAVE